MQKTVINLFQSLAPALLAKFIYAFMSKPKRPKFKKTETKVLQRAVQTQITYNEFTIMQYRWEGTGDETILLIHGWEGHTGNFANIIPALNSYGYNVLAFDAPSHGKSAVGKTHMFDYAHFLIQQFGNSAPNMVISHSLGSVTTAMTLMEHLHLPIDLWMMITTPHTFMSKLERTSSQFGLNVNVINKIAKLVESDVNKAVEELDMVAYCKKFNQVKKAVIVQSRSDKVIPVEWARIVNKAFEQCELIELDNLGHYGILKSTELTHIIEQYLAK